METNARIATALSTLLVLALGACGGGASTGSQGETAGGGDVAVSGASCALVVRYEGSLYYGRAVQVVPPAGSSVGTGVLPACDDGGGASGDEEIELVELAGVSPDVALVVSGFEDTVFVREGATLPPEVEQRLRAPTCDARDEPIDLSGTWLGILGADGNTEVDLEPPYDIDLLVEESSPARYEGAFLTVRVPESLGRPLSRADVKSSLWEGGSISMQVRCGDDGTYRAESITAAPPG